MTRELVDRFRQRNGSVLCCELLGYDISTPEGFAAAKRKQLFARRCSRFVRDAAEIVVALEKRGKP